MFVGFDPTENVRDSPLGIDHKRASFRAHVFLSIHVFLNPDAVGLDQFVVRIGKKWKWQPIFRDKFLVTRNRIDTDAENFRRPINVTPGIAQSACLRGAAGRVVLRIKIKSDRGTAKIRERNIAAAPIFAADCDCAEIRRAIANCQFNRFGFLYFSLNCFFRSQTAFVFDRFELQRRVMDLELHEQIFRGFVEQRAIAIVNIANQVRGQCRFRRAHWPDMKIVHSGHVRQTHEISRTAAISIPSGTPWSARLIESRSKLHVPQTITAAITKLTAGSIHRNPVTRIAQPASTTPSETAASAAICMNAPRMFRSRFRPEKNMSAVTVLMTMPIAATQTIVFPATSGGLCKRRTASQAIAPTETRRRIPLKSAARMDELFQP